MNRLKSGVSTSSLSLFAMAVFVTACLFVPQSTNGISSVNGSCADDQADTIVAAMKALKMCEQSCNRTLAGEIGKVLDWYQGELQNSDDPSYVQSLNYEALNRIDDIYECHFGDVDWSEYGPCYSTWRTETSTVGGC